jgi:hypothetical protein
MIDSRRDLTGFPPPTYELWRKNAEAAVRLRDILEGHAVEKPVGAT